MVFDKNTEIINNICKVQIRSIDDVVDLPTLAKIYHTPSKISYTVNSTPTAHGNIHKKRLKLSYPGLSQLDFKHFDTLIKGAFQVMITLDNTEVYEISSSRFPMSCSTSFSLKTGHNLVFNVSSPLDIRYIGLDVPDSTTGKSKVFDEQFDYDFDFNLA